MWRQEEEAPERSWSPMAKGIPQDLCTFGKWMGRTDTLVRKFCLYDMDEGEKVERKSKNKDRPIKIAT